VPHREAISSLSPDFHESEDLPLAAAGAFPPILDALKLPRCGFHAFRHTHSTLLINNGATPKESTGAAPARRPARYDRPVQPRQCRIAASGSRKSCLGSGPKWTYSRTTNPN